MVAEYGGYADALAMGSGAQPAASHGAAGGGSVWPYPQYSGVAGGATTFDEMLHNLTNLLAKAVHPRLKDIFGAARKHAGDGPYTLDPQQLSLPREFLMSSLYSLLTAATSGRARQHIAADLSPLNKELRGKFNTYALGRWCALLNDVLPTGVVVQPGKERPTRRPGEVVDFSALVEEFCDVSTWPGLTLLLDGLRALGDDGGATVEAALRAIKYARTSEALRDHVLRALHGLGQLPPEVQQSVQAVADALEKNPVVGERWAIRNGELRQEARCSHLDSVYLRHRRRAGFTPRACLLQDFLDWLQYTLPEAAFSALARSKPDYSCGVRHPGLVPL
jgi:hypothetical protein